MGSKKRFSTRLFCEAWMKHGKTTTNWNKFVGKMREEAGDETYAEDLIRDRIAKYTSELRRHRIPVPKYPKKRMPTSVSFFKQKRKEGAADVLS